MTFALWVKSKGKIFLVSYRVYYLQIKHVISFAMKDYQIHDCLSLPGFSLQQHGGMCLNPTKGFFFLPYKQPKNLESVVNLEIFL